MRTKIRTAIRCLGERRGFTLVEMVVVIAILGVMAAVAVPLVTNNLSKSKQGAYAQDLAMIQSAVDSYYTASDNPRHLGLRQYPIKAKNATGAARTWTEGNSADIDPSPGNPVLGTQGGEPYWRDNADGQRDTTTEEVLLGEAKAVGDTGAGGWYAAKIDLQGTEYTVDTRGYFIDFAELVAAGLLKAAPESASTDNGGVAGGEGGSYSWYIDSDGNVGSILEVFPYNGLDFAGNRIQAKDDSGSPIFEEDGVTPVYVSDLRGFQEGIYP